MTGIKKKNPSTLGLRKHYSKKKISKMSEFVRYMSNLLPCIKYNSGNPLTACIFHHLGMIHERNTHAALLPNLCKF